MTLQKILTGYKKRSWIRLCSLHNINKWDLVDYLKEPVYASKYHIKKGLELTTQNCFKCHRRLKLTTYKEVFIGSCDCSKDKTHLMTTDKLSCIFTKEQILTIINDVNLEKRKGLANTVDYWIAQGLDNEQAQEEVIKVQKSRSLKSPAAKKGARGYSIRTIEYWINKGLDYEDATLKIKEVQTTNGLEYYKNKYGDDGEKMFNERIRQWLDSPGNKDMINNRSKKSIELFEQIGKGHYGSNEKTVRGKNKVHRVDFLYKKKIIEFYGDYWHGNPKIYSEDCFIRKKKITEVWEHDRKKIQDLKDNGYDVMIIWEMDFKNNPEEVLKKCKDFISC
jgi:G:T-mismatch repair DNA endonuclease (very short patch repair protein)